MKEVMKNGNEVLSYLIGLVLPTLLLVYSVTICDEVCSPQDNPSRFAGFCIVYIMMCTYWIYVITCSISSL